MSESLVLYGDKFAEKSLSMMRNFWEEQSLCDFTVEVEKEQFNVHKLILASSSDYFKALFAVDMLESAENKINMQNLSLEGFKNFLEFAYSGRLVLSLDVIADTVDVCNFLQASSAMELCLRFINVNMSFDNAPEFLHLADTYSLASVYQNFLLMVAENFSEYINTKHFLTLDVSDLCKILGNDCLRVKSEAEVFLAAYRWCQHDSRRWARDGLTVFRNIRFILDGLDFIHFVRHLPQFRKSPLRDLTEEALGLMYRPEVKYLKTSSKSAQVRAEKRTLVTFGGEYSLYENYDLPPLAEGEVRAGATKNYVFLPNCKSWMPLGAAGRTNVGHSHVVMLEVNDYAMLIGGYVYTGGRGPGRPTAEVLLFSPGDFSLWPLRSMIQERAEHAATQLQDFVYVTGGRADTPLASVERYDMRKEFWHMVAPLPHAFRHHSASTLGDKIIVCGGFSDGEDILNTVYSYTPKENVWKPMKSMLVARAGHAAATLDNQLIVCGGRRRCDTLRCLTSVESYSQTSDQWTYLEPMKFECAFAAPVVLDGELLLVGGEDSANDLLISIQKYRPKSNDWGMYAVLPRPMNCVGCCALKVDLERPTNAQKREELQRSQMQELKKALGYSPNYKAPLDLRNSRRRCKSVRF